MYSMCFRGRVYTFVYVCVLYILCVNTPGVSDTASLTFTHGVVGPVLRSRSRRYTIARAVKNPAGPPGVVTAAVRHVIYSVIMRSVVAYIT